MAVGTPKSPAQLRRGARDGTRPQRPLPGDRDLERGGTAGGGEDEEAPRSTQTSSHRQRRPTSGTANSGASGPSGNSGNSGISGTFFPRSSNSRSGNSGNIIPRPFRSSSSGAVNGTISSSSSSSATVTDSTASSASSSSQLAATDDHGVVDDDDVRLQREVSSTKKEFSQSFRNTCSEADMACCGLHGLRKLIFEFLSTSPNCPGWLWRASLCYHCICSITIIGLFVVDSTTAPTVTTSAYWRTECIMTCVWGIEYLLRLWSCVEDPTVSCDMETAGGRCRARFSYSLRIMSILDSLSMVSLVVDLCIESNSYRGVSALRMLRLLTLFRIERDFGLLGPVLEVISDKRAQLLATLGIALFVLSISSVVMFYAEAPSNDEFNSVLMSMWWGVTALTTVGYGDIVPKTGIGRFIACIVAFMGTGLFGLFAGILADGFREAFKRNRRFQSHQERQQQQQQHQQHLHHFHNPGAHTPPGSPGHARNKMHGPMVACYGLCGACGVRLASGDVHHHVAGQLHRGDRPVVAIGEGGQFGEDQASTRIKALEDEVRSLRSDMGEVLSLLRRLTPNDAERV